MSPMFIKRNSVFAWLNESAAIAGKEKLTIKHSLFKTRPPLCHQFSGITGQTAIRWPEPCHRDGSWSVQPAGGQQRS